MVSFFAAAVGLLCALLSLHSVDAKAPVPATPSITATVGCGSPGMAGCRTSNRIEVQGTNFAKTQMTITFAGGPSGRRYVCANSYANTPTSAFCFLPDVDPVDQTTPLLVRASISYLDADNITTLRVDSNDYEGVFIWGALSLTGGSGCAERDASGFPSGCLPGDQITLTGSGFGYPDQGVDVGLQLLINGQGSVEYTVQSNTEVTFTLPYPRPRLNPLLIAQAGVADPMAQAFGAFTYATFPYIAAVSALSGCRGSKWGQAQNCASGDVIQLSTTTGLFAGTIDSVTLGSSYNCLGPVITSPYNASTISCTLPQVQAADQGKWLSIVLTFADGSSSGEYVNAVQYAQTRPSLLSTVFARLFHA